jgi:DNA-binding MarR family transcriptional regulator
LYLQDDMTEQNHSSIAATDEADLIAQIIGARQKRTTLFGAGLFGEPTWDMMLELFHAELEGRTIATSELARKAGVPATTSLRWTAKLERQGWVRRVPDAKDLRRAFVELSQRGSEAMRVWLKDWLEQSSRQPDDNRVTDLLDRIRGGDS